MRSPFPVNRQHARCAWVGSIPLDFDERQCIIEVEVACGVAPVRMLVRRSTGVSLEPSYFAIARFNTLADALRLTSLRTMT